MGKGPTISVCIRSNGSVGVPVIFIGRRVFTRTSLFVWQSLQDSTKSDISCFMLSQKKSLRIRLYVFATPLWPPIAEL